jgi:hypothetical protein
MTLPFRLRAVALHLATVYDGVAVAAPAGLPDDTAAALIRLQPTLSEAPPKAFWQALIDAAAPHLRAEVLASLRRRAGVM